MTEPAAAPGACALCGRPGTVLYESLADRLFEAPGSWSLRSCQACGLVFLDPMPGAADLPALYDRYFTHEAGAESLLQRAVKRGIPALRMGYPEPPGSDLLERMLARVLAWIPPLVEIAEHAVLWLPVSRRGRLLDVGCGDGAFLERMRDFGWEIAGAEPDPRARRAAAARLGPDVPLATELDDPVLQAESFDAVTLSHVIEHVPDPLATLRDCTRLLAPGGLLVCLTPNTASLGARSFGPHWLHWDPPRHLHLFDPDSLAELVTGCGLALQRVSSPGSSAHFVWQASTLLERRGRLPGARVSEVSPSLWAESLGFWMLEYVLTWLGRRVGEELLVVGEKARA